MIKICTRDEVLQMNPVFTHYLIQMQEAKYSSVEEYHAQKDFNPFQTHFKWAGRALMVSEKQNTSEYLSDLAHAIEKLRIHTHNNWLLILGDWSTPWLFQKNKYKPVKDALKFLKKTVSTDFNGGFLLQSNDLIDFIPKLFWLTRCNMALPEFFMSFENVKTIFTICKHGVLHFESYDNMELKNITGFFKQLDFHKTENCYDPVFFDDFDRRKLKMS